MPWVGKAMDRKRTRRRSPWTADLWNEMHAVGTKVRYRPVLGSDAYEETVTRSEAWSLGDGTPVVSIDGRTGGVSLAHIEPVAIPTASSGSETDPARGVYCWRWSLADGIQVQFCSHVTPETPHWCEKHRWASSVPCLTCTDAG
jgi:hypothetical protein